MLILLCPFPAYNHYAKNINKPVWDNEGFLTQQMTGFLYPLKEDGTTQTVYDSSTNGATLGEETVTRMKNYLRLHRRTPLCHRPNGAISVWFAEPHTICLNH